MKKLAIIAAVIGVFSGAAFANDTESIRESLGQIDSMQRLPVRGLNMIQAGDKTFLVSENGRIVILGGKVIDMWSNTEIKSTADVANLNRINLSKMKTLNLDELATFKVGKGSKEVAIFVDPECPYCIKLMQQMPALYDKYTFRLVVTPLLGNESGASARKIWCADRKAGLEALMTKTAAKLENKDCDMKPLQKSLITSQMFGIEAVPYVIAPNGVTGKGMVDLSKFLADNQQ